MDPTPKLLETIARSREPILLTHVYPDGDALGSELACARLLRQLGAFPRILNVHPAPAHLAFLAGEEEIDLVGETPTPAQARAFAEADLILVLDTPDVDRLGFAGPPAIASNAPKLLIDHHLCLSPELFDGIWSRTSSPATGCLVAELAEHLGVALDPELARLLFVALATDTGWFRFSNSSGEAFELAAQFVEAGADPAALHAAIHENSSLGRTRLLGEVLAHLEGDDEGRIVHAAVTVEMRHRHGVGVEDIDGFIDVLKEVRGAEILILFVELSSGSHKVSLRSKGACDVHPLAVHFGGGGHAKAAGFRLSGASTEVRERVLAAARDHLPGRARGRGPELSLGQTSEWTSTPREACPPRESDSRSAGVEP